MSGYPQMLTETNHVEPVPRRVRAVHGDRTVVDTTDARYVWEHRFYPQFYLPPESVPEDVVQDEGRTDRTPQGTVRLHSLPNYYGYYLVWLIGVPVFTVGVGSVTAACG